MVENSISIENHIEHIEGIGSHNEGYLLQRLKEWAHTPFVLMNNSTHMEVE